MKKIRISRWIAVLFTLLTVCSYAQQSVSLQDAEAKAEQGDLKMQLEVAASYALGKGAPQNYAEAAKWFRKAAEQGDKQAQSILGKLYYNGQGVPLNHAEAAKWHRKAAEQGSADAQAALGNAYLKGEGVMQDHAEAEGWYRKAAEGGDVRAMKVLAGLQYLGEEFPQNYAEAAKWLRQAAEQGEADSQRFLSLCYYRGHGVPQDFSQAYIWMHLAEVNGDSQEPDWRQSFSDKLSPADVKLAEAKARSLLAGNPKLSKSKAATKEKPTTAAPPSKSAKPKLPPTLTIDGTTYTNVTYSSHDATSVSFFHSSGVGSVPIADFPEAIRKTLGYNEEAAAKLEAERAKLKAARAQQGALQQARLRELDQDQAWGWNNAKEFATGAVKTLASATLEIRKGGVCRMSLTTQRGKKVSFGSWKLRPSTDDILSYDLLLDDGTKAYFTVKSGASEGLVTYEGQTLGVFKRLSGSGE